MLCASPGNVLLRPFDRLAPPKKACDAVLKGRLREIGGSVLDALKIKTFPASHTTFEVAMLLRND